MPAVAITDHGQMYGVVDFYEQAEKAGVKPIIGVETLRRPRQTCARRPAAPAARRTT